MFGDYDSWCSPLEHDADRCDRADEDDYEASAFENGENNMTIAEEVGLEDERSGVLDIDAVGGIRLIPTVEDLDELPAPAELSEDVIDGMIEEARDSLALLNEANRTGLILTELCHLPDESVAMISAQCLQLLGNKHSLADRSVDVSRAETDRAVEGRREAEVHVLNALGPYRAGFNTGK